ncbi:MAG: hypothetical protein ACE5J3_00015 [Methanosarcinales archaeon]
METAPDSSALIHLENFGNIVTRYRSELSEYIVIPSFIFEEITNIDLSGYVIVEGELYESRTINIGAITLNLSSVDFSLFNNR